MNSALGLEGKPLAPPSGGGRWGIDYREGIAPDPLSCQVGKPQLRKGRASPSNSSGYPLPWESREESGRKGQFLSARGTQGDSRDTPGGGHTSCLGSPAHSGFLSPPALLGIGVAAELWVEDGLGEQGPAPVAPVTQGTMGC